MAAHGRGLSGGDLQQALDLFRAQFAAQLPARLAQARERLAEWREQPGSDECLRGLHRVLHRLAGSAGTFGMPEFGSACNDIELQLDAMLERPERTTADVDAVGQQVTALDRLAGVSPSPSGREG